MAAVNLAYLVASALFILSLRGLSSQETARRGNLYGMIGMAIALVATAMSGVLQGHLILLIALAAGAAIGVPAAMKVAMTSMPELVAVLHSFVGLAAVFVGLAAYLDPPSVTAGSSHTIHLIEVYLGVWIGGITFTGSIVAFLKLRGILSGKPLLLPGRHMLNLGLLIVTVGLAVPFLGDSSDVALMALLGCTAISFVLGVHLVAAIGGADMPVVVSMLNSYSGWAAAAAGFMLGNDLLIVTGALVGSSGAILSYIMCRAMNRSFWSVIFGGFGASEGAAPAKSAEGSKSDVWVASTDEVRDLLLDAQEVMIVPGYGMAVAQAQHIVRELTALLRGKGKRVRFAIHPVAGRLPGHMNVLLAEANVPYDIVFEMDEVASEMDKVDVSLVVGANDIVNPGALDDPSSPIYGMPVIHTWESRHSVVLKRGMAAGYAGVDNPLYYLDNTAMYFGDAKDALSKLVTALRES
jgi:NAD(P) transhydrogenase subunit beta